MRGVVISFVFHTLLVLAVAMGLPFLQKTPVTPAQTMTVDVVRLSDITRATKGEKPKPKTQKTPDSERDTTIKQVEIDPRALKKLETKPEKKKPTPEKKPEKKPVKQLAKATPTEKPKDRQKADTPKIAAKPRFRPRFKRPEKKKPKQVAQRPPDKKIAKTKPKPVKKPVRKTVTAQRKKRPGGPGPIA